MSGPKGYGFTVMPSPAELARREVAVIRGRCAAMSSRLVQAEQEAANLGNSRQRKAPRAPKSDEVDDWRRYEARVRERLEAAEAAIRTGRQAVWAEQLARQTSGLVRQLSADLAATIRQSDRHATPRESVRTKAERSVASAVEVASTIGDDDLRALLLKRATAVAQRRESDSGAAVGGALRLLQAEIQSALRHQRREDALNERRSSLDLTLAEHDGADAAALRASVWTADHRECDRLDRELARIQAQARIEADRAYVVAQASAVLRDLGYEVDADDEIEVLEGSSVTTLATSGRSRAMRLQLLTARDQLLTNAVAVDDSDDVDVEQEFCTEQQEVRAQLARRGVALELVHHTPVGQVPVERLSDRATAAGRPRRRRKPGAKESAR